MGPTSKGRGGEGRGEERRGEEGREFGPSQCMRQVDAPGHGRDLVGQFVTLCYRQGTSARALLSENVATNSLTYTIVVKNVFYVFYYCFIKNMFLCFYSMYIFYFKNIYNILTWPKEL